MKNMMKLALISLGVLSLSACSQLRDVEHQWCGPESVKQEEVNLSADALFKFGKSNLHELLPSGKAELDQLVHKLHSQYLKLDSIHLIGHTDRLGSDKFNYELGLRRANTVKAYLEHSKVNVPISVESAGESMPVTKDCVGNKATPALTACLQPDRRVVIKIHGVSTK